MRAPVHLCLIFAALLVVAVSLPSANAQEVDAYSGLKTAPNWQLVLGHCGGCHSYKLITAQRGDRDYWLKTIRWMQRTQNLWELPAEVEGPLLDYLAENYSETEWGRRPPLSPILLPQ